MLLDQDIGSMIAFVLRALKGASDEWAQIPFYYVSVPEGFVRPSVYAPPDETEDYSDTLGSFRTQRTLYLHFFGRSITEARQLADTVRLAIMRNRISVPILTPEAEPTGGALDIKACRVQTIEENPGTCLLETTWDHRERYPEETPTYVQTIEMNVEIKPDYELDSIIRAARR